MKPIRKPLIQGQFRLRTMISAIALAAVTMFAVRMSVPEDGTLRDFIPLVCFALMGIWAARLREWNDIGGGVLGGIVGAISSVATQYVYYHSFHFNRFGSVIYLGPLLCLIVGSVVGSIVGLLLGSIAWVLFSMRAEAPRDRARSFLCSLCEQLKVSGVLMDRPRCLPQFARVLPCNSPSASLPSEETTSLIAPAR
jgi:peptidoglycan/LPS O-acetylase OafA/YrhL